MTCSEFWGLDVCLRSHFMPFWRQRQAHSSSRAIFLLAVHALTTVHCSPIFPTGHQLLVMSLTKQPFWDRHDLWQVKSSLSTRSQQASFLAASTPHGGDWLQALPISIVLWPERLADEAMRI